jgi:hypothetical protein
MRLAWVLLIAACYASKPSPHTLSNKSSPTGSGIFTITETSFGPIHAKSQATLTALRAAFVGYDVRAANDSALSYSVYLGDEKLAWVIPNEDGSIFNVHATSPKVEAVGHDWRVGRPFHDVSVLTHCECWGENPTCYRKGDHIAVNFRRECLSGAGNRNEFLVLEGEIIQRVIWSPKSFPEDDEEEIAAPDPCAP